MSFPAKKAGSTGHESRQKETYVAMISRAIAESCTGALTLKEIYSALEVEHPDIGLHRPGWKNTTRHCLSMNPCFVNGVEPFLLPGNRGSWRLDANAPKSYSRKKSGGDLTKAQMYPLDTSSVPSTRPSSKSRRQRSLHLGASASTSRTPSTMLEHEEDTTHRPSDCLSFLNISNRRENDNHHEWQERGWEDFDHDWEESFHHQSSPCTQNQQQEPGHRPPPALPLFHYDYMDYEYRSFGLNNPV